MQEHKVLNAGFVKLIDCMGDDESIVRSARQSFDQCDKTGQDKKRDAKLINYLWRNGHSTPFESVVFTFQVKAPIFVLRQWQRHRTQSYNEVSARYTELPEDYYVPEPWEIGIQDSKNKQSRNIISKSNFDEKSWKATNIIDKICSEAFEHYLHLLNLDVPREVARMVLPVNTYSTMTATANLNNWFKFLGERLHPHAQYEIRCYAEVIRAIIKGRVPVAHAAFMTPK